MKKSIVFLMFVLLLIGINSYASGGPDGGVLTNINVSSGGNSGAAVTSIPIVVPPGIKGIQPNLSLNYSSLSRNGWIGVGWNLDIGAIQRSTKRGVDYDADDYVATKNGGSSELVSREADWGANYYGAKIEGGFSRYLYIPGDDRWEVTSKDGTKYFYGKDPYSSYEARQDDPNNPTHVFKWCLVRVQDTNGNYMTVTYSKDTANGQIYLDQINYTGNGASGPNNYVKFYREHRTDAPPMYNTNFMVKTEKRLKTIEIKTNDNPVRAYSLSYSASASTSRSILETVQQHGSYASVDGQTGTVNGGKALPGITLLSSTETNGTFGPESHPGVWTQKLVSLGDFNGDGLTDMFGQNDDLSVCLRLSNGDGTFGPTMCPGAWTQKLVRLADFNGDGLTDMFGQNYDLNVCLRLSNGDGTFGPTMCPGTWTQKLVEIGDFNGDGKADIFGQNNDLNVCVRLGNGDGTFGPTVCSGAWMQKLVRLADFNGDGMTDMFGQNDDLNVCLRLSNGDGTFGPTMCPGAWTQKLVRLADFNGDGLTDMFGQNYDLNVCVRLGNGDGTFGQTVCSGAWTQKLVQLADFNGDGMTDMFGQNDDLNVCLRLSNGDGTFGPTTCPGAWTQKIVDLGDFNGDGKADMFGQNDDLNVCIRHENGDPAFLLTSITNGIGGITTLEYTPSSAYPNNVVSGKVMPFIVQTLSAVEVNDGNGNISRTEYYYENGNFDYDDRSFWGFDYVSATSLYNNDPGNGACIYNSNYDCTISETWFNNDDIKYKGLPLEQRTSDSSGNLYTKTINLFDYTEPATDVHFPRLKQKDDYVYDGTATADQARIIFDYDGYGNIIRKDFYGDVSLTQIDKTIQTEYWLPEDFGKWMFRTKKTSILDDAGALQSQQGFTYHAGTGNPWKQTMWNNEGIDPVIEHMTYDAYGNATSIKDPRGYILNISHEYLSGYLKVTRTNPFGQGVVEKYNYDYGQIFEATDTNGHVTTTEYDEFGRVEKVTNPNDTGSTYGTVSYDYPSLAEYGNIGVQKVKTYTTEKSGTGDHIWSEAYFDGLGRPIKTRTEGPDGKVVVTDTVYNDGGKVDKSSDPYFEGLETPRWTIYEYDAMGRRTVTDYPDGTYATYEYSKGTLTYIDPNGYKKVEVKDIYGRNREVREYTGNEGEQNYALYATTTYEYDVLGNLTDVWDAKNNHTEVHFDSLSRKKWMNDPDMGHWEYDYDGNGNLIYQKDAKNQELTFQYDEINRLERKIYPDTSFIEYRYDEAFSTNATGRLTTLIDVSGTTKYYYDKVGRAVKTIKTVDLTDYTTETAYDALGRTDTLTYPDGTVIRYEYDTGGNLNRVVDNATEYVYAVYTGYNARGQQGQVTYGNGVTTSYNYKSNNDRLDRIVTNSPSAGNVIDLTYNYDGIGNILDITDGTNSTKSRSYLYDEQSRLKQATSTSYGGTISYDYDEIGNMVYNSQYGTYIYDDPDHAHAVKRIVQGGQTIDNYEYDANGNMESGAGRTLSYNYDNMSESIIKDGAATISIYDAGGNRVKKAVPGATTIYIGDIYECKNSVCTRYIFGGTQRLAKVDNSSTYFYHSDHLGSATIMTSVSATVERDIYYYPYGETHPDYEVANDITNYKFTDQEYDAETRLYYYNARYYDPKLARFASADTVVPSPMNPQAFNRYSYVVNNPVIYTDPSGHLFSLDPIGGKLQSKIHDDILGIERVDGTMCYYIFCGQGSIDFTHGDVRQTQVGAGVGYGWTMNVHFKSFDMSSGYGWAVTAGYERDNGSYLSAYGGYGYVSGSGTYYFKHDVYQVGVGIGSNGISISASYSNVAGWSVGGGYGGASYTYNLDSGKGRLGFYVNINDLVDRYEQGMGDIKKYPNCNGFGPQSEKFLIKKVFNPFINTLGIVTVGAQPSCIHDGCYLKGGTWQDKLKYDFALSTNMMKGALQNLRPQPNGVLTAVVGVVISPTYGIAVAIGGQGAFKGTP